MNTDQKFHVLQSVADSPLYVGMRKPGGWVVKWNGYMWEEVTE